RWGPPIARPGKIICLGKNYADHAMEFDAEIPDIPIYFSKAVTSITGPFDPVILPREARRVDGEVELAAIVGRRARRVSEAEAMAHVAGFTVLNDVTDRDAQRDGKQWFRGKSADTFCPLGPFLVTCDEIADASNLNISSKINGLLLQESNTRNMIFKLPFILSHLSRTMTLEAGDILSLGTPGGIGSARNPPICLRQGDTMEAVIENIGRQINAVIADK
ncbi:MAG: fumarylacetoacetate hydrolase family protein, partial [Lentisphaerota bacterium]